MKQATREKDGTKNARSAWSICLAAPSLVTVVAGGLLTALLLARPGNDVDEYVPRAERALESGDYQTAATCYARLLQRHPADSRAAAGLEASLRGLGQDQEAEALHRRFAESMESTRQPAH